MSKAHLCPNFLGQVSPLERFRYGLDTFDLCNLHGLDLLPCRRPRRRKEMDWLSIV